MYLLLCSESLEEIYILKKQSPTYPTLCGIKSSNDKTDSDFPAPANAVIRHERHQLYDGKPTIVAE